jgi:hypothetical protein
MESTSTLEPEEMSGRVLGIIGAYRMSAALDPRGTAPADPQDARLVDDAGESEAQVTVERQVRKTA